MFVALPSAIVWNLNKSTDELCRFVYPEVINGVVAWSYPSTNELVKKEANEPVFNAKTVAPVCCVAELGDLKLM